MSLFKEDDRDNKKSLKSLKELKDIMKNKCPSLETFQKKAGRLLQNWYITVMPQPVLLSTEEEEEDEDVFNTFSVRSDELVATNNQEYNDEEEKVRDPNGADDNRNNGTISATLYEEVVEETNLGKQIEPLEDNNSDQGKEFLEPGSNSLPHSNDNYNNDEGLQTQVIEEFDANDASIDEEIEVNENEEGEEEEEEKEKEPTDFITKESEGSSSKRNRKPPRRYAEEFIDNATPPRSSPRRKIKVYFVEVTNVEEISAYDPEKNRIYPVSKMRNINRRESFGGRTPQSLYVATDNLTACDTGVTQSSSRSSSRKRKRPVLRTPPSRRKLNDILDFGRKRLNDIFDFGGNEEDNSMVRGENEGVDIYGDEETTRNERSKSKSNADRAISPHNNMKGDLIEEENEEDEQGIEVTFRRRKTPWSAAEKEAVEKGYKRFGRHWAKIKSAENAVLKHRSNVQIKVYFI